MGDAGMVTIPGIRNNPNREFMYLECSDWKPFEELFNDVTNSMRREGRMPLKGGATTENTRVTAPDGRVFFGLSYRGDIPGWREGLKEGLERRSVTYGITRDGLLILSNGDEIDLSQCEAEYY